ncbi:MAG: S-adenosylhomocysteine hydrolase [Synechococcus sp. SB0666_bin_14]|nr:S-adenosylhomocysteine hydrolase [Synechococcus sp. SB0666_bin_14]MYA90770.1 S-adenosylhomocysteine hydrolase [Synechococcus sp. SB0663_bin_10]MYG47244.1 S-adenosylhomocysteine hydrolase [Synechococcus sp. SB0675_bin_6]MYK91873.1 S-adenosylhomocysteine hydrolase [Synechococcus sp. SB0669_bin_8]
MTRSTVTRPRGTTTAQQLQEVVAASEGEVVLRRDLKGYASPSQLSRALRQLMEDGKLVRIGSWVYAKARPSSLSGRPVPRQTLAVLAAETFDRLGIAWELGEAQRLYRDGLTTQIPWRTTFDTGHRRISRRLRVGQRVVNYENKAQSR